MYGCVFFSWLHISHCLPWRVFFSLTGINCWGVHPVEIIEENKFRRFFYFLGVHFLSLSSIFFISSVQTSFRWVVSSQRSLIHPPSQVLWRGSLFSTGRISNFFMKFFLAPVIDRRVIVSQMISIALFYSCSDVFQKCTGFINERCKTSDILLYLFHKWSFPF